MKLIIYYDAYSSILNHAMSHLKNEIGGFLFGTIDNQRLLIRDAFPGKKSGSSVHVEIDNLDMIQAIEQMNEKNPSLKLIGWYHSHPGMGAHFFSQTDVNTQSKYQLFFPEAIGIVIDPRKKIKETGLIQHDFHVWKVKNKKAVKGQLYLEKSFKLKKDNHWKHLNSLEKEELRRINELYLLIKEKIDSKISVSYINSKYHVNFQRNRKKIWLKLFTSQYKEFQKNDLLVFGNFTPTKLKAIREEYQKKNIKFDLKRPKGRKIRYLKLKFDKHESALDLMGIFRILYNYWNPK